MAGTAALRKRRPSSAYPRVFVAVLLATLAALAAALLVFAIHANGQRVKALRWQRHTLQVQLMSQTLRTSLGDAENGQRGYLLVGDPGDLSLYRRESRAARDEFAQLRALTADNPNQRANTVQLGDLIDQRLAILQQTIDLDAAGRHATAVELVRQGEGQRIMGRARAVLGRIEDEERRLLTERTASVLSANADTNAAILSLGVLGGLLLVLVMIATVISLRALDRVKTGALLERAAIDLKLAYDFLQSVINGSVDPIFVKDRDGCFVLANDRAAALHGASQEALRGKRADDVLPPKLAEVSRLADHEVMAAGQAMTVEERFLEGDEARVFLVSRTPWRDGKGGVAGVIAVAHDITDRKADEDRLRDLNEGLESRVRERTREIELASAQVRQLQKMEAVGQLTGGIAHDFNNMLAIVIGSLDIACRRWETEPHRALSFIENAQEGARRAAILTARLLAFARRQPLEPEPLDPNKLVSAMSDMLRRTLGENLRVETVLGGGVWKTYIDAGQLENALVNLCVNARDAMPDGGRLTIETSNAHLDDNYSATHAGVKAGQYVLIAVTDTGAGMAPDIMEQAFDPFFTTKGVGRGTGLGLSQVYGFVKQSGGDVRIYSEPDQGTTVRLYLPRHIGDIVVKPLEAARVADRLNGSIDEVILVVEDEPGVRQMSVGALRELGYTVVEAENAVHALMQLAQHPAVSLLFTDIVMPGMNGRRLADEAVERRPGLKVLYTTGYTQNAVIHNGVLDAGVALLSKPFGLDELSRKVRQVLDKEAVGG